jgi:hypothetical protein
MLIKYLYAKTLENIIENEKEIIKRRMVNSTKPGRIGGGIIAIVGGSLLIILLFFDFNYNILIMGILGIIGGSVLLDDWTFGGGLALVGGTYGYIFFLLPFWTNDLVFLYILSAGLIGLGGFTGIMSGSQSPTRITKSEFELIDDWIDTKTKEISATYNVIKIEFFNRRWDGLVFLVEFEEHIDPKYIKNLIAFLEESWNRKVFLMTKAGLNESDVSSSKYVIYQKEGSHLDYILEDVDMNE